MKLGMMKIACVYEGDIYCEAGDIASIRPYVHSYKGMQEDASEAKRRNAQSRVILRDEELLITEESPESLADRYNALLKASQAPLYVVSYAPTSAPAFPPVSTAIWHPVEGGGRQP